MRLYPGILNKMQEAVPQGFTIGHCWSAAAKLWIDLPEQTRLQLLTGQFENSLVEVVREIIEERIGAGRAAAEELLGPRGKKRGRKG